MKGKHKSLVLTALAVLFAAPFSLPVLLLAGYPSIELLVSDGLDRFTGQERIAAQEALVRAQSACVEHVENLLRWKMQVVDVKLGSERCPYSADLQTYTFFGIPTGKISIRCGTSVHCKR